MTKKPKVIEAEVEAVVPEPPKREEAWELFWWDGEGWIFAGSFATREQALGDAEDWWPDARIVHFVLE